MVSNTVDGSEIQLKQPFINLCLRFQAYKGLLASLIKGNQWLILLMEEIQLTTWDVKKNYKQW